MTDIFEVDVQLDNMEYVPTLSVEASFKLDADGPYNLTLDLIIELPPKGVEPHDLVFTMDEMAQIRFAVADAIERKYWSGEYNGGHDEITSFKRNRDLSLETK